MPDVSPQRPTPSATGTLAATPLSHALVYVRNKHLTGIFELRAPDGNYGAMLFWRGRIANVKTSTPVAYFGALVYELGFIDSATLDATLLEVSKKKALHGEILVQRGAITAKQRDEVLVEQTCRKVHHLFSFPAESTFAFYDAPPAAEEPKHTVDPLVPTWRGVREHPLDDRARTVLAKFATTSLKLVSEVPGFGIEETSLCEALVGRPMTIGQMRATAALSSARVDIFAYLLIISKCIEPATPSHMPAMRPSHGSMPAARPSSGSMPAARPSSGSMPAARPSSGSMPAAPPASGNIPAAPPASANMRAAGNHPLPRPVTGPVQIHHPASGPMRTAPSMSFKLPSSPAMRAAITTPRAPAVEASEVLGPADVGAAGIAARMLAMEQEDYFQVLGVPDGASIEAVRAAYFRLVKLWHPDRLPPDLSAFRPEVETIFAHITRAQRTLTDPDARRGWLAARADTNAPKKRPRNDVLREIDGGLAKGEFAFVEEEARRLVEDDADDTEARAISAWAAARGGEAAEDVLRASITALDRTVQSDNYCERAYYYRAQLHKRLDNHGGAIRDFGRVVQLNPKHIDAAREVRVYEMRARKGSGEHSFGNLRSKVKAKK